MVSLDIIEREITELEARDTSYATIERLAWLYVCRDHLKQDNIANEKLALRNNSEFMCACDGCSTEKVLEVLQEHLEAVQLIFPKEYDALIKKIKKLK